MHQRNNPFRPSVFMQRLLLRLTYRSGYVRHQDNIKSCVVHWPVGRCGIKLDKLDAFLDRCRLLSLDALTTTADFGKLEDGRCEARGRLREDIRESSLESIKDSMSHGDRIGGGFVLTPRLLSRSQHACKEDGAGTICSLGSSQLMVSAPIHHRRRAS